MKGGNGVNYTLSPDNYDGQGQGLGDSLDVQVEAGMSGGRRRRRRTRRGGAPIISSGGRGYRTRSGGARRRSRRTRRSSRSRRSRRSRR